MIPLRKRRLYLMHGIHASLLDCGNFLYCREPLFLSFYLSRIKNLLIWNNYILPGLYLQCRVNVNPAGKTLE